MAVRTIGGLPKIAISLGTSSKSENIHQHRLENCCSYIVLTLLLKRLPDGPRQPSKNVDFARDILKTLMRATSHRNDFRRASGSNRRPQHGPKSALKVAKNSDFARDIFKNITNRTTSF
jgi:hypothetical protein